MTPRSASAGTTAGPATHGSHGYSPALPDPYTPGNGTPDYTVRHYELDVEVKLAANRISGRALLHGTVQHATRRIELDLHTPLRPGTVTARSSAGTVRVQKAVKRRDRLVIELSTELPAGTDLDLEIPYSGTPTFRRGTWGEVGWEELTDGVLVAAQPNGASTWFPCVDHPSVKSTYRFSITTDAGYLAVCNGVPSGHRRRSSREQWDWELTAPVPAYLATVQIGRYQLTELSAGSRRRPLTPQRQVASPVFMAVSPALKRQAQGALALQNEMMACFERHYGPYPYERYTAVVTDDALEIPLESASLSIFGANHLDGTWASERLIAHELAHQWFGNALTVRQWKDIWLHEGFACYSEWVWSADSAHATLREQAQTAWRGLAAQPQDLVLTDPGAQLMFDDRIYKRGALALYALRCTVGAELFDALLRAWVQEHLHGSVDTEMFLSFAERFLSTAGIPEGRVRRVLEPWLFVKALPGFPEDLSPR